jgi:hypothetical protein
LQDSNILSVHGILSLPLSFDIPLYRFRIIERGKSGQRRVPHHLTGGIVSLDAVQLSVTENNRRDFGSVRVKMRGKSSRGRAAMYDQDKPCGLKCHVHPYVLRNSN